MAVLLALVAAPVAFQPPAVASGASGTWTQNPPPPMIPDTGPGGSGEDAERSGHTATTITGGTHDGDVLVAGGHRWVDHRYWPCCTSDSLRSAQRYDTATSTWIAVPPMHDERSHHTANPLSGGRVVVAGGFGDGGGAGTALPNAQRSVEVWDGTTWTKHLCAVGRYNHTATLLSDGKIVLAGGQIEGTGSTSSVEIFDPSTGLCTAAAPMVTDRAYHTATLISSVPCVSVSGQCDRVLVTGGVNALGPATASVEIFVYVPGTAEGTWVPDEPLPNIGVAVGRQGHTATLLDTGKVLVAGGMSKPPSSGSDRVEFTAWLFTPGSAVGVTGSWLRTGDMNQRRYLHTATKLPDGQVLVVAGNDTVNNGDTGGPNNDVHVDPGTKTSELYNPTTGGWTPKGSLVSPHTCPAYKDSDTPIPSSTVTGCRLNHEASLVTVNGVAHVLVTGGASHNTGAYPPFFREKSEHVRASVELYHS